MLVTSFDVGRWMLVTNMAKTLTNILKLSPTHFIFNIDVTTILDDCDTCPSLGFVPESDRVPIQLRRTTFVVYNMTRSRAFYEDGLGMIPIYGKKS